MIFYILESGKYFLEYTINVCSLSTACDRQFYLHIYSVLDTQHLHDKSNCYDKGLILCHNGKSYSICLFCSVVPPL